MIQRHDFVVAAVLAKKKQIPGCVSENQRMAAVYIEDNFDWGLTRNRDII